jgi:hypothetical protein
MIRWGEDHAAHLPGAKVSVDDLKAACHSEMAA